MLRKLLSPQNYDGLYNGYPLKCPLSLESESVRQKTVQKFLLWTIIMSPPRLKSYNEMISQRARVSADWRL